MDDVQWFGNPGKAPPTLPGFEFVTPTNFIARPVHDIAVGALQQLQLLEQVLGRLALCERDVASGQVAVVWFTLNHLLYARPVRAGGPLTIRESVEALGDALQAGAGLHRALRTQDVCLHAECVQFVAGPFSLAVAYEKKRQRNACDVVAVRQVLRSAIIGGAPHAYTFTMAVGLDAVPVSSPSGDAVEGTQPELHIATVPISLEVAEVGAVNPTDSEMFSPLMVPRLPRPSAGAVLGTEWYTSRWPIDASLRGTAPRCLCGKCEQGAWQTSRC